MEVPRKPKRIPRKQFFVYQIDQLLKLTEAQLKVWLYHYRREGGGEERKSWASRDTVGGATGFSRPTITHARTWLVKHGWLTVVGFRPTRHGGNPVREYRCLFPMAQGKAGDPLTVPQGKTSDPLQGKASDPSKVKPAAPEVKGPLEVTAAPIPDEVILTTNSFGNKQANEQTSEGEPSAPAPAEEYKTFEAWLTSLTDYGVEGFYKGTKATDGESVEYRVCSLVKTIHPVNTPSTLRKELIAAWDIVELMPTGINPLDVLGYNRVHKKGKLIIRSCPQYLAALQSEQDHLLNDYCTHDSECKDCKARGVVTWSKRLELNRLAEEAKQNEARQAAWQEAENQRLARLAGFDFRVITFEDSAAFKAMRGDDWVEGCLKKACTPTMWADVVTHPAVMSQRHAGAAILFCLQQRKPISWDAFCALVEEIKALDTPCRLESYQATHA